MYYMLGCFGPLDEDCVDLQDIPQIRGVSWNSGQRIEAPVPVPIVVGLDPEQPGVMLPMFYKGILLMSNEMIEALRGAGVDNLDIYETVLRDPFLRRDCTDYKAVNIIGLISCADLSRSDHLAHGIPLIDVDFNSLVIDEERARGALMFRLAENVSGIVVHERVRSALERSGIKFLEFDPPEEWIG